MINKVIPTSAIIEMGVICIHGSMAMQDTYGNDRWIDSIDQIFMGSLVLNLVATFIWIYLLKVKQKEYSTKFKLIRLYEGSTLFVQGILILWTAFRVRASADIECVQQGTNNCVAFEFRAICGVLAIIDGIMHTLRPTMTLEEMNRPLAQSGSLKSRLSIIDNDPPSYDAPPSYEEVERGLNLNQDNSPPPATTTTTSDANLSETINHL